MTNRKVYSKPARPQNSHSPEIMRNIENIHNEIQKSAQNTQHIYDCTDNTNQSPDSGIINRLHEMPPSTESNSSAKERRKVILREIQEIDFALMDTTLYLDAYPRTLPAMEYFNRLIEKRNAANERYRTECGSLRANERIENNTWLWINDPWPWSYEAN